MSVGKIAAGIIALIITIVIVFSLVSGTAGTLVNSSIDIQNNSGLPLAGLFGSGGIVLLIFMAGILLLIVGMVMKFKKS